MTLRDYLREKRMTYGQFAERLHMSTSYVHFLATNQRTPTLQTALRIEELTGGEVTVRDWLPETSEPSAAPEFSESQPAQVEPAPVSLSLPPR